MDIACIPFSQTGYFSKLILDYLDKEDALRPFVTDFADKDAFRQQIKARQSEFTAGKREVLFKALSDQHADINCSPATIANLELLQAENTFTVVTGHQLNLFTGPLYFLYKILSAIKLCASLKTAYPEYNFVPVYWMATEDHDFEEINHFTFKGKKLRWNRKSSGAVGQLDTAGLEALYDTFIKEMGGGDKAEALKKLFAESYLKHKTLGTATRFLANSLFGNYGLLILDGDDPKLKRQFIPQMKRDIFDNVGFTSVNDTIAKLQEANADYPVQVNPREINYFYLREGLRERLVSKNGSFGVVNTNLLFTKKELLAELEAHPGRFSPNVIARPLYQEVILPNLCYIGGGGELSYWLELKGMFGAMDVPFPLLMLRNSVLMISEKQGRKLERLNVGTAELFLNKNRLINKKIREISNIDIDFGPQRRHLQQQFEGLYEIAEQTDASFLGAVKAQEVKQLKGLDKLEKRLLKAQKRKLQDQVSRLAAMHNELFPGQGLQERQQNFADFYLELGEDLIPGLLKAMQDVPSDFLVLRY